MTMVLLCVAAAFIITASIMLYNFHCTVYEYKSDSIMDVTLIIMQYLCAVLIIVFYCTLYIPNSTAFTLLPMFILFCVCIYSSIGFALSLYDCILMSFNREYSSVLVEIVTYVYVMFMFVCSILSATLVYEHFIISIITGI